MRPIVFLFLLSLTSFAYGQSSKPAYFIDSVKVGPYLANFSPQKIESIYVSKEFVDTTNNLSGAIYITTKKPNNFNFLGVNDIKKAYKIEANGPTIYMLDKEFIIDTQHFKIDSSFIYKVDVIKGVEFQDLKNDLPNLTIVKIYTDTKDNRPSGIIIRGKSSK
jgi:hypothetical protein